jgi:hypothetical protein
MSLRTSMQSYISRSQSEHDVRSSFGPIMSNNVHHALVIGASGLIGWSVVNNILAPYPSLSPYSKVTAFVNRPLQLLESFWPEPAPRRPSLALTTGMNLLCSDEEFVELLRLRMQTAACIPAAREYNFVFHHTPPCY